MPIALHGRAIDYEETGAGPAIVLVPGSFSTMAAWRPVVRRLADRFRCIATSLPGYGGSTETRDAANDIASLAETVEAVIRHAGEPVHLVGHSFGGCTAMAVAIRGRVALSGLTMFEANPADILREAGESHLHALTQGMLGAYRTGVAAEVAPGVIDFWGGAGSFAALPAPVQEYVRRTADTNARDWQSALEFTAGIAAYRAIPCPAHFVHGSDGHAAARRMAELLAEWLPLGRLSTIPGASHFMISTHPNETAAIIAADATRQNAG